MVVAALTDTVICAHCSCVDLCSASLSVGTKLLLLLRSSLNDCRKFLLLSLEVFSLDSNLLLHCLEFCLLLKDTLLGLVDILLCDLSYIALVLDLLIERVILTAVCNVLKLSLVLLDLSIALSDVVLVLSD